MADGATVERGRADFQYMTDEQWLAAVELVGRDFDPGAGESAPYAIEPPHGPGESLRIALVDASGAPERGVVVKPDGERVWSDAVPR